mmetsp:Transcript_7116/g.12744  ORF Transcript_7116/g.12744 Transcript_7116/m.12744 type:complete len:241 (+) Transcript_7116:152-874(+)
MSMSLENPMWVYKNGAIALTAQQELIGSSCFAETFQRVFASAARGTHVLIQNSLVGRLLAVAVVWVMPSAFAFALASKSGCARGRLLPAIFPASVTMTPNGISKLGFREHSELLAIVCFGRSMRQQYQVIALVIAPILGSSLALLPDGIPTGLGRCLQVRHHPHGVAASELDASLTEDVLRRLPRLMQKFQRQLSQFWTPASNIVTCRILCLTCVLRIHGEVPLVQATLASILPHHCIDG